MNEIQKTENLTICPETANILAASQDDAGFEKLLKFKKGIYEYDGGQIPLGTTMVAHCVGWAKAWIKFKDKQLVDRRVYRMAKGDKVPDRTMLDDRDERLWLSGLDGRPQDPWVFQFLLPMENTGTEELFIFVTQSFGGRRAVAELCNAYARRAQRQANCGQPVIRLQVTQMPTNNFGNVVRPHFEIVGWNDGSVNVREVLDKPLPPTSAEEFNDQIPF